MCLRSDLNDLNGDGLNGLNGWCGFECLYDGLEDLGGSNDLDDSDGLNEERLGRPEWLQ